MTKSTGKPPRPECLEEPCLAWHGDKCGHQVTNGMGSCALDDPERRAQRAERMRRAAMEGK